MEFGALLRRAWGITWRHPFLWLLGIFAGGSGGGCSFSFPGGGGVPDLGEEDLEALGPSLGPALGQLGGALTEGALILVTLCLAGLLFLLFLGLSSLAQGSMAQATAELGRGRASSLGLALRAGVRLFWRYLGLMVLLIALVVGLVLLAGLALGLGVALADLLGKAVAVLLLVLGIVLGLFALLLAILVGIPASIVLAYAQRAMAVEDLGPLAALASGFGLLRRNLVTSLLVWVVNFAVNLGIGLVTVLATLALALPLVAAGVLIHLISGGLVALTLLYGVLAGLFAFVVLMLLAGVANAFHWSYWTLAYLRLRGEVELSAPAAS